VNTLAGLFTVTVPLALMATAASGGGTVTTNGHVPAGLHQVSVFFVTRTGYYTKPAPPSSWTALGGSRVIVSNIPTGPPNVIQRILIFTTAAGAVFFFTTNASNALASGGMVINDNTTTTATVDFTDVILAAGSNAQYLFSLIELEECAGVVSYATRLFWWGMRNRVPNFVNLPFDGGFDAALIVPNGWTLDPTSGAGGGSLGTSVFGRSYAITGNGATALRGMISQTCYQDWQGNTILRINTAYSARIKLKNIGATQGNFVVEIYSPVSGSLGTFTTALVGVSSTGFQEFIGPLLVSQATIPTDAVLRIYASGTVNNLGVVSVDNIELFPTLRPYLNSTLRGSLAGQPESFIDESGVLQPFFQDGGTIRNAFVLREKLYIQKDDKWYETVDDGANEPSSWKITQVSGAVGAAGPFASDVGEDWGIVANRSGPYIFWGGEPVKIGQEVQSDASQSGKVTWSSINWAFGYTIWVLIDKVQKRVLIGAPTGAATSPNVIFYLDYRGLDTAQEIADHWSVKYSQYSGKILAIGNAPKWSVWNISSNSGALIERSDGTTHTFIGNGAGTGRIYDLLDSNKSDGEAGIPWSYTTYYAPGHADEQVLQIKSHRKLFSYLTGAAKGAGAMSISMQPMGNITPSTLQNLQLVDPSVSSAITAISRVNSVVTVTCGAGHGLTNGIDTQANVLNAADFSFNGTVPILGILNATQFTYYQALPDLILGAGGTVSRLWREFEYTTNTLGERVAYTFANAGNAAGCWCQMEKIIMSLLPDPWAPVRGSVY
ncbi:MAG TPA: hypothetical protein VFR76_07000, partial [Verrucomicrobiae bacterium]|nr:hypothetical protein [Verrucomicrobiae bacterium]